MRALPTTVALLFLPLVFFSHQVLCQFPFSFSPDLSPIVKTTSKGVGAFINLWEFSLEVDDKTSTKPVQRKRLEPKTLLAPDDQVMMHLIPQDGSHPLYLEDKAHSDLRREFLLNHLVLDPISPADEKVSSKDGVTATTLSGRSVLIRKDSSGRLTVENVTVLDVLELSDGTLVYRLANPLFNLKKKVKQAFDKIHSIDLTEAIGPPLVIPERKPINPDAQVRAPAPPPPGEVGPPAIPPNAIGIPSLRNTLDNEVKPPGLFLEDIKASDFQFENEPQPPAPPPSNLNLENIRASEPQPPAPPPFHLKSENFRDGEPQPPAPPPFHLKPENFRGGEPQPPAPPSDLEDPIFILENPQAVHDQQ